MDVKDEKILRKLMVTTLEDLIDMVKEKELREVRVETGELKIGIKLRVCSEIQESSDPQIEQNYEKDIPILSNLVGVFHRASHPYDPPIAEEGNNVQHGQIVGYIESMGLMHEVKAVSNGKIKNILIKENEPVQYGQKIMFISTLEK